MYGGPPESSSASGDAALSPNPNMDPIFAGLDVDNTTYLDRSTSSVGYSTLTAPVKPATALHAALQDPEQLRNIPFDLLMAQDANATSSWMPSDGFTHAATDTTPKTDFDTPFPAPKRQRFAPSESFDDSSILHSGGSIHPGVYSLRRASWTFGQPHFPSHLQSVPVELPRMSTYLNSSDERSNSSEPLSPVRERSQELPTASRSTMVSSASMMGPPTTVIGAVSSVKARANQKKRKRAEEEQAKVAAEESKKTAAIAAAAAASKKKVDDGPIKPPPHIIEMVHHRQMQRAAARQYLRRAPSGSMHPNTGLDLSHYSDSVDEDTAGPSTHLGGYPVWMYHPGVSTQVPYHTNPSKNASGSMPLSQDSMGRRYSWHAGAHGLSSMMPPAAPYAVELDRFVDANVYPRHPVATADE